METHNTPHKLNGSDFKSIPWKLFIPIILALSPPLFYLNGKAFHEGYLSYLNLNPTMYPIDSAATMLSAVIAWTSLIAEGLTTTVAFLGSYWLQALLAMLVLSILTGTLRWSAIKLEKPNKIARVESSPALTKLWWKEVGLTLAWLSFIAYGFVLVMLFVVCLLLIAIVPFFDIGKKYAAEKLEEGFVSAPRVWAVDPQGTENEYRVIECSDSFCALYRKNQIVTVPLPSITWAVSAAPGQDEK